ncbi:hypothetical protein NCAS_0G03740 [Naumovozyma castellii]|uniref:tRNA wybutosine-synthesizing protein 2 n=1 Tax=Naumovozyma castellii TaxID=27288 RepID=G0VHF5_NAUCA|nr:hypothetical protein NCAS_0G03740 [Naumovozyma castellii CBS 4309]CCC71261.1 hypothetical protein NCAS_0G03740 [Naumovozyma castellii CBS 4309]
MRALEIVLPADEAQLIKPIKTALETNKNFIKPIHRDNNGNIIIRTNVTTIPEYLTTFHIGNTTREYEFESETISEHELLRFTRKWFETRAGRDVHESTISDLINHTPFKYSKYPPLLLFNNSKERTFRHDIWSLVPQDVKNAYFNDVLSHLDDDENDPEHSLKFLGINKPILETDVMRQPKNIDILYSKIPSSQDSDDIWCSLKQNGIWQVWNPLYTMFSRGNIKEKKRVLDMFKATTADMDVVDLYCGIGYFSFSYLMNNARNVFGFDLNKWSIEGLNRGLILNKFEQDKCHFFNTDNEKSIELLKEFRDEKLGGDRLKIRHINLGLLPSSKQGWPIALKIIQNHNNSEIVPIVSLHIHENVHIDQIEDGSFVRDVVLPDLYDLESAFQYKFTHLEKIKTFAPDVWHVCIDIDVICG